GMQPARKRRDGPSSIGMRLHNFKNRLEIPSQLLRKFFGGHPLACHPASPGPISFDARERMALFIEHPLDLQHRFDFSLNIEPLVPTTFLGLEKWELRFPEPQHVSRQLGNLTDFADFIKNLAAQPGLVSHDRSSWRDELR